MDVGFTNGNIVLDQSTGVYYPGQVVSGNVNFKLEHQVNIKEINIQFLGEARVSWWEDETEERNGRTFERRYDYHGHEQYFNYVQQLVGGVNQLQPGPHTLPFQYQIPPSVPSSFRGDKGEIVYEIRVYMEFPEPTETREELVRLLEVVAPLDLNKEDPEVAQPLQMSFEEVYSCGCTCSPSPISIEVGLPVVGYCPGQAVPVAIDVRNQSSIEVKRICLQIFSRYRYHSQQPIADYTTPEEVLVTGKTKPILSKMERHFTYDLIIPDMIAPNLNNCSIIDVEYYFRVTIKLSDCNDDLEDESQICIGLIPLDCFTKDEYVHPMAQSLPPGPIPEYVSPTVPPQLNSQTGNPINAGYPGYPVTSAYPNTSPGYPNPLPTAGYPYPAAMPGYPAPTPGYPTPNYEFGFKESGPNQPVTSGYPMQIMPQTSLPAGLPLNGQTLIVAGHNQSAPSAPPML